MLSSHLVSNPCPPPPPNDRIVILAFAQLKLSTQ